MVLNKYDRPYLEQEPTWVVVIYSKILQTKIKKYRPTIEKLIRTD